MSEGKSLDQGKESLKQMVTEALKNCYDPEIPINVVDLGLVYDIQISEANDVFLRVGLTSPGCPVGYLLEEEVKQELGKIPEIRSVSVEIVTTPVWTPDRMSEDAKRQLGLF